MTIFATTLGIGKASLRVLRAQPRLMLFPALAIAVNLTLLLLLLPGLDDPADGLALALVYFLGHGVAVFFSAGLVSEALRALRGDSISLAGGLGCAAARFRAIAAYSIIESTVGLVLGALARGGRPGRWLKMLLGGAWSLFSYLGLPVLIAERRGGYDSLRRSGELLRQTWGETAVSELGFRVLLVHMMIVLLIVCVIIARLVNESFALVLAIALVLAGVMVAATLQAIYRAALYIFAAEGVVPDGFDTPEMHAVWHVK
ncbi:MAG TPA: DUF6159 family protein [Kofleriaceae bacterium]|nr:DUF6159 family protein [Kofleriaceae bacterium]